MTTILTPILTCFPKTAPSNPHSHWAALQRSDEGLGTCSDCKGHLGGCNAAQRL